MRHSFELLVDSDAWVALLVSQDPHHVKAAALFDKLAQQKTSIATTNLVIGETATVLSRLDSQATAKQFIKTIHESRIPVFFIDEKIHRKVETIFLQQNKKGTSMVDCANVATASYLNIETIFSFDTFYTRQTQFPLQLLT